MSASSVKSLVHGWETVRYELLNRKISDLNLKIEGSAVEPYILRLRRELEAKGFLFKPAVYLTDEWGCPDRTPVIGIPFYLADPRLSRLEEEQTGEIEDAKTIMMLLRHEAGHAVNYAFRLWERSSWKEIFGSFSKPYRDFFRPVRFSRQFVRHIATYPHGRTYAQKHPDEDFAETFAVWLTPRSDWRRRYLHWPVLRKLKYINRLMREVKRQKPKTLHRKMVLAVHQMNWTLAEHYGKKADVFRRAARGYVDDRLREVFPPSRADTLLPAVDLFRRRRTELLERVIHWSSLDEREAETILRKLESRANALRLRYPRGKQRSKEMDVVALTVALALDYAYTGKLTG
ncbi:MAG: putative zinc-binding metallopeptidase [Candidatus Aminicenantes bacterium]|nr:putative zinc-binding metallopeptidase [Candidatus Aminicenantes bacterium]